jgi:hypothetical protein
MNVCFDTSGLNQLMDDPDSERLTSALLRDFTVYITAFNIVEIGKTTDPDRREQLRAFEQRLAGACAPLALPNQLVQRIYRAFHNRIKEIDLALGEEGRHLWWAMSEPYSVGEAERLELKQWVDDFVCPFAAANEALRPEINRLFAGYVRPSTPKHHLRSYMEKQPHTRFWRFKWLPLYGVTADIYKRATDCVLPLRRLEAFLTMQPPIWPLYLADVAYSIYCRAFWEKDHGPGNLAGMLDLWFAVYLPFCDVFVTHDKDQYRALRFLNVFNSRRPHTRIWRWSKLRTILSQAGAANNR